MIVHQNKQDNFYNETHEETRGRISTLLWEPT